MPGSKTLLKKTKRTVKATVEHSATIILPSMATKPSLTEKSGHDEKGGMFGYFTQLLKSIKDILTKKNSKAGDTSSVRVLTSGAIPSFQRNTTTTSVLSDLSAALSTSVITRGTFQPLSVTPLVSSAMPATTSTLQLMASKALDISLAMQPLHQVAFNVTGVRKAALCEHSSSHENSTMRGGIHSGVFKEVGTVNSDAECISQCCVSNSCDAAFLLSNRCFLVKCKSKTLCQSVPAKNLAFRPRVIYIENRMALAKGQKKSSKPLNSDIQAENIPSSSKLEISLPSNQVTKTGKTSTSLSTAQLESRNSTAVCGAPVIRQNVTLRGGIKSGHFKDQGTVESMQRCIELCCNTWNCSVAFMLLNRCFSVSCYNETACNSIPARSLIFQPQLAYIRRKFTSKTTLNNHFETMKISKTRLTAMASSSSSELLRTKSKKRFDRFQDNCRYGNSEKDVTLRGGLNAGSFLDSGVVHNITACIDNCCHATKCDVAFMIMKRCFLVTCYSSRLCQSVPARNLDYFTEMVHVARDETGVVRDLLARLVQPSSPSIKSKSVRASSVVASTDHRSLPDASSSLYLNGPTGGTTNKHLTGFHSGSSLPSTPPAVPVHGALIESAIAPLNVNKQGDVGLIQTFGMSTIRLKNTSHSLDQTITPSSLRFNSISSSSQGSESVGNVRTQGKELEIGTSSKDEICQSTDVYYNATMRGGINAGVFKDQGPVQNMRKCIEQCCRWQFCSVAFMLLTRCYIIACYNDHLCDPVPARNVTFTPRVAFVSRVRRDQGNFSNVLENIPTPTLSAFEKSRLKTSTRGTNLTTTKAYSNTATIFQSTVTPAAKKLPSSLAIKPSPSQAPFSKVFTSRPESRHNCTSSKQKHNVTLRGGLSAGHFKDRGKVADMKDCVDLCCKEDHCDVALMLLENCFTVVCHNKRLCESVPAKTGRYRSRIVYVGKTRSDKSAQITTHKLTKTVSLLDAALRGMGGVYDSKTSQSERKTTDSNIIRDFDSKQLTQLLTPSLSVEEVGQRSNILKVGNLTTTKHSTNQSGKYKDHQKLILQKDLNNIVTTINSNASASQHKQLHLMSTSVSSGHNISLLSLSTVRLNASVLAHPEPNKSATERDAKSGHTPGLASTFGNPSQHSFTRPSSCLNSPISYNVTLRNGIRSGYFRDQGRVENMGVCIQKCCGAEDCDVAFLLKQRCYLVTCYTKKGCETVPARHSLFRPRVSHVKRTNVSQLMSFMDEQKDVNSSEKTVSIHPRSSTKSDYITPSSTLPAPNNSLDSSSKHNLKPKTSPASKAKASLGLHNRTKHRKIKSGRSKSRSGKGTTHQKSRHVTVAPELKKRKARKSKNSRQIRHRNKLKATKRKSSRAKLQKFKDKLVTKKDQKLSHSDLDRLFQLMKPKKRLRGPPSKSNSGLQKTESDGAKKSDNSKPRFSLTPAMVASTQDNLQTATVTDHDYKTIVKKKAAPNLHQQSSAFTVQGPTNQRTRPTLAAGRTHAKRHKSQKIAKGQKDFATQVKTLLEKEGSSNENTLSHDVKPTKKANVRRKTTTKPKATYATTKDFLDYVKTPTGATSRLPTSTRVTSRLITTMKPTVKPPRGSSHHRSKYRATKSTVPSLPTQAPGVDISSCVTGPVEHNQTLRGGLSSGLFHEVGKVNDIEGCSQHCCSSPICDLAFMVLNHCFLVTCSSSNPRMCESTPALATNFNPMISRVLRRGNEGNEDQSTTTASNRDSKPAPTLKPLTPPPKLPPQVSEVETSIAVNKVTNQSTSRNPAPPPTPPIGTMQKPPEVIEGDSDSTSTEMSPSPPGCISSLTEHNVTLRGGLHAGKFTDAGKVNGSYTCTEMCCKADNCDVAFFAFHRCFLVTCFDEYLCASTPSLLPNFNPTVVHVYRHHSKPTSKPSTTIPPISDVLQEIEDETVTTSKRKNKTCAHSEVYEEVTLRNGYKAGNFTSHGKVNSTKQCVDVCCSLPRCDLIFMFLNNCFTVSCSSGFACEIIPARQSRFKPKVVYFIKNNSSRVIKPSELNSSLSDPKSFEGTKPVNAVHYKELRSKKKNGDSYKKDFSQMSNDTETVDEEFIQVPDNKITSRNVINSAENATTQGPKHNDSEHSVVKSGLHSTKHNFKQKHELKLKSHEMIDHKKSRTDEKMDLVLNKLTNVTEENKRLEGELHVLMAKHRRRSHKKKLTSSGSAGGEHGKRKSKKTSKNIKKKKITNTSKQRMNKLRFSGNGSGMDSTAWKRVVLVDTDRPPVFPPTDEHNIEEHSIHAFERKMHQKDHHLRATGKSRPRQRPLKKQHNYSKVKSKHWDPTNEHAIEEHVIYNSNDASGQGKEPETIKNARVRVEEGSEIKYGQPEEDKDDLELDEILNLKPKNETAKEPEKPVWISSRNKNEDDLESFHEKVALTPTSRFHVDNHEDNGHSEDEFHIENEEQEKASENNMWIGSSDKDPDRLESFHEQISPTHRSHFQLDNERDVGHTSKDEFHIEHQEQPKSSDEHVWTSSRSRNKDHMDSFHEQIGPTHRSHFEVDKQKVNKDTEDDDFDIENETQDKPEDSDRHVWINLRNRNEDKLDNFHDQIAPTHTLPFRFKKKNKNENSKEDEFHIEHQDEPNDSEKHVWENSRNRNEDHMESFHEQIPPTHRSRFRLHSQRKNEDTNKDESHIIEHQHEPSLHEVASGEPEDSYGNEKQEMSDQNFANSERKKPETSFSMSNSAEPTLLEFNELDKNMDSSRTEHSVERPVSAKNDFKEGLKRVPKARDKNKVPINDVKANEEIALTEKSLNGSTTSSETKHSGDYQEGRKQANYSHEKPDFDAIYNKINNVYNRLQDLFEAQSQKERNATHSSLKKQEGPKTVNVNSRRREEGIPTPPVSAKPTTRSSRITLPTKKAKVVKQYVTDHFRGSGVPSHRHRDALMDYIKTIYSRVQELYKRKLKRRPLRAKASHRRAKVYHALTSGDGERQRKTKKERSRSRKAKKYHRKNAEEAAVLREMKRIYKNMKEMYHQQRKEHKKAAKMLQTSEGQNQRSYIPASYGARKSDSRTNLPVSSVRPIGLVPTLERRISLNSTIAGTQVKPEVENTDYGQGVSHELAKQPKDQSFHRGNEYKPTEPRKAYNNSIRHGGILADNLASKHPTVNQSFIDRIVAEIQAEHPIVGQKKSNKSDTLQQLIDNVADSVVKQVTDEFNTGPSHKPSRRVNVPKPPLQKNVSVPKDRTANMPLLNDHPSRAPHLKSFLESAIKKLASKEEGLPPEMINSDEITGNSSPDPPPEDVNPPSMSSSTQEPHFSSQYPSRENHPSRRPQSEQPGQQEIRQMFKFKHHLKKKKPMAESGKKKLFIPATTEGNTAYLVLHMGFENIENRTALDSSGHNNNAILSPEVRLSVTESKCGSALSMRGGRLLFTRFSNRPREAITIALWLKLDSVSGTATLFKTAGSGAKYHLQIADGIIHWSHVDDLGHVIFSMETRQTVDSLDWTHVSATYDAHINMSKIILNGEVLDEKEGFGLLSQNWDGEVGIGISEGIQGLIDEFYMYNHALAASDLSDLSEECNPGAGGAIPLKEGSYDGLIPEEVIEDAKLLLQPNATTTKMPSTAPTTLTTASTTPTTGSTTQRIPPTTPTTRPATTTTTTTTTKPTTTSLPTSYKPTLQIPPAASYRTKPDASNVPSTITLHDEPNCQQGMFYFNSELRGGMDAGLFIDLGRVRGTTSCLKFCCEIESCDLVYMTRDSCYAVDCFNNKLCEPVAAVPYKRDMPSVYYVTRNGKSVLDEKLKKLETRPTTRPTTQQPTTQPPPTILTASEMFLPYQKISTRPTDTSTITKRFCAQGMFFYDVKLRDGWNAGMLLQAARVDSMTECVQLCCDEPACDFVMLKKRRCYTVRCKGGDTCTVEEGGKYQISFVSRQDMVEDETISIPTPTPLPLSPLGSETDDLPGNHVRYLSLYLGFDHVIGSVAVDGSGLNNDARLTKGTEVARPGRRGAAIKLNGGDVLLDGEHFREKPREAVTIALWVKLWRTGGVHSMFDTIGGHSIHNKGQYHFEVYNGRLRWFHRNEYAKDVFNVRTSPVLQPNLWYHVVGTYDSRTRMARVFVNGDLVGEGRGSGMLSLDWEAKAGFGSHSGRRILLGYLDEIYIFRRALQEREIDRYLENPVGNSLLGPDSNDIYTESYNESPSSDEGFSDINTDSVWFSRPTHHLTKLPLARLPNSTLNYMDQEAEPTATVSAERAKQTSKQTTLATTVTAPQTTETTTQSTTQPTTLKASATIKTTAMPPTIPSTAKESLSFLCRLGNVYRNRDLVGGLGAGNFTDKGRVDTIEECMKICCGMQDCSVAYMVDNNCFAITCKEKEQCKTFIKNPLENSPVIGFVDRNKPEETTSRPGDETKKTPTPSASDVIIEPNGISKASYTSEDDKEPPYNLIDMLSTKKTTPSANFEPAVPRCTHSSLYRHVTLTGGLRAGNFTRLAEFVDMDECARKCCARRSCDVAILMRDTCFGLQCSTPELCSTRPAQLRNFSLKIMYIYKESSIAQTRPTVSTKTTEPSLEDLLGEVKPTQSPTTVPPLNNMLGFPRMSSNHVTTPKPPTECSQGLTINNVILNGGMGAGEVAQFPHVSDLQLCIEKCCLNSKCHLAYVIQDVCYTVNCFSRDLCRTRPIENTAVHSVISYVRRSGISMFSSAEESSVENLRKANIQPTTKPATAAEAAGGPQNNTICQKDRTFYNVQLKGRESAGEFTERGLVSDVSQCAGICCEEPSCDLAYTEGQRCYTVKCYKRDGCQLIEASPLAVETAMAYVVRLRDKSVLQVAARPTEPTTRRMETTKQVMSTTNKPTARGDNSKDEISNHANEPDSHRKEGNGQDSLRPYHVLKQKLHKHHHHHKVGSVKKCQARRYGCQHYCIHLSDGGHRCMCRHGYSLAPNGRHCEDLDECTMGVHSCSHMCHNTPGSYTCSCKEGYQLQTDKRHCIVFTEVGSKKDQDHPSVSGLEIPTTITLSPKDVTVTQGQSGIFHCKARGHPAPHIAWASGPNGDQPIPTEERFRILPSGSLVIRHVNFTDQGMYRCVASNPAGSATAAATLSVRDFDECSAHSHDCQQVCVNTDGSFRCECHSGFMLQRDRKSCEDVNECTVGSHFCDDICHNTLGSYTCHCTSGYRLLEDRKTCLDIDECTEPGHGCSQLCNNTLGSYNCLCLKGFWLEKDNKTCVDHHVMLDSTKPATLSAGMGAFVAIAVVSVLIVIGTVLCVIRYRRRARLRGSDMVEGEKKSLFSWME
ncbi:uncharacterized protein LOC144664603 isoform X2 [Oculina patagonica]